MDTKQQMEVQNLDLQNLLLQYVMFYWQVYNLIIGRRQEHSATTIRNTALFRTINWTNSAVQFLSRKNRPLTICLLLVCRYQHRTMK